MPGRDGAAREADLHADGGQAVHIRDAQHRAVAADEVDNGGGLTWLGLGLGLGLGLA